MKVFSEVEAGDSDVIMGNQDLGMCENVGVGIEVGYNEKFTGIPQTRKGKKKISQDVSTNFDMLEVRKPLVLLSAMGLKDTILTLLEGEEDTTYWQNPATWQAEEDYEAGDFAEAVVLNGVVFECTTGGTSGAVEPAWDTDIGNTTADGTVVWTARALAVETVTFSAWKNSLDLECAQLGNYNLSAAPVVYSEDLLTKYTVTTDYTVEEKNGRLFLDLDQKAAGSIASGATVKVASKMKPITFAMILFDPENYENLQQDVEVRHNSPQTGGDIEFILKKVQLQGIKGMEFNPEDYSTIKAEGIASPDEDDEDYEFGYIAWLPKEVA